MAHRVAPAFEAAVVEKLDRVRAAGDIGPVTAGRQLEVVERHVRDAVELGATILAGGPEERRRADGSLWFNPTVLDGRTEAMALFAEETFGPVLPIVPVSNDDEAVHRERSQLSERAAG